MFFKPAFPIWLQYTNVNIQNVMDASIEELVPTFGQCFANCTNRGPPFDYGIYNSKSMMCYCGKLSERGSHVYSFFDPFTTVFKLENGFDCSCSDRILKNM
uniref:WSC domain-containing protein n=1 Tax=Mesocestoides corti TaxID=53468 RepID=A0A5K3EMF6_MESCO